MKVLLFLATALLVLACKSSESKAESQRASIEEIYFFKGPCFGKCPNYELRITSDDKLHLKAINFVEPKGEFTVNGKNGIFQEVKSLLKKNGFSRMDNSYMLGATDIPTLRLSSGGKSIEFNFGKAPDGLKEIVEYLQNLRKSTDWK